MVNGISLDKLELDMNKAGAFGNWEKLNERIDFDIVKQVSEKGESCVSAVGQMLMESRNIAVTQAEILAIIGEPASIESLRWCLNRLDVSESDKRWYAGYQFDVDSMLSKRNFAVTLKEFGGQSHAVFVKEFINGRFIINDTFDQSYYEMTKESFNEVWTGGYIFYGEDK